MRPPCEKYKPEQQGKLGHTVEDHKSREITGFTSESMYHVRWYSTQIYNQ